MTSEAEPFSVLLRRYRQAAALSQEALAERAALSVDAVSQLERGRRAQPRLETVQRLTEALGLSPADRARLLAAARPVEHAVRPGAPGGGVPAAPSRGPAHNLPAPTTALLGREREVAAASALLCGAEARLLTLIGPGGIGKTRLAIEVARALLEGQPASVDGAWLVELAPLADPALVVPTVAATLGLRETPGTALLTSLIEHLVAKRLLLLLDNCEHLIEPCAELATAVLRACPDVRILATSREGLAIPEETLHRVPALAFPDPQHLPAVEDLPTYAAVALLLQRAQARREEVVLTARNAQAMAEICARLDGIPLAIELAASRLSALPVEEVAARLDDCFRLLTAGSRTAVPRQRTLRATLDWSHALLSPPEQALLRRLAVFAGGWTLEAAEAVCADDAQPSIASHAPAPAIAPVRAIRSPSEAATPQVGMPDQPLRKDDVLDVLAGLVDKSLVVLVPARSGDGVLPQEKARYRLLETVRQYAQEQLLAAGESAHVRHRHLAWCLALAEEGDAGIKGPEEAGWLQRLETEHDNLRAALAWSMLASPTTPADSASRAQPATGLRLAGALWWFWVSRGHNLEGQRWLDAALAGSGVADTRARARALIGAGYLYWTRNDKARRGPVRGKPWPVSRDG
jgi:non-specific serine/threonine protein kinase